MLVIFFLQTWWIVNEFEKAYEQYWSQWEAHELQFLIASGWRAVYMQPSLKNDDLSFLIHISSCFVWFCFRRRPTFGAGLERNRGLLRWPTKVAERGHLLRTRKESGSAGWVLLYAGGLQWSGENGQHTARKPRPVIGNYLMYYCLSKLQLLAVLKVKL